MKKLTLIIAAFLLIATKPVSANEKVVQAIFERGMTKEEVKNTLDYLRENDINIENVSLAYRFGKLTKIGIAVSTNDGFRGEYSTAGLLFRFKKLVITRDRSENAKVAFCIGDCDTF